MSYHGEGMGHASNSKALGECLRGFEPEQRLPLLQTHCHLIEVNNMYAYQIQHCLIFNT